MNQGPPSKPSGHAQDHSSSPSWETLGDFSVTSRTFLITALAIPIGLVAACFSLMLLRLISFFTNVFYFGKFSLALSSPANHHLGWLAVFIPVIGAVIVGLMARYGSDRIRGHGIPEAIESILLNGSRIQPKIALLKPVSAAIAIGSGGPFGAEGPIIMTGGAFGSMVAQMFHLTSAERKTLLVAGAAAGMSATFAAPVSAVLLAIELLLFERKPRSIIPVALASGSAAFLRHFLLGDGPLFPAYAHASIFSLKILLACLVGGFACGLLAIPLSNSVYKFEELFARLPIHWMWWPALGGLVVGLGGLIFPPALGVGYDVIGQLVQGDRSLHLVLGVLIVKWLIWSVDLGSGTSGGVLAPVMMIGAAAGALFSYGMPDAGPGFWALMGITGVLSGALRVPLTAIIFTVEQTHDWNLFLPLMLASVASYAASTLLLRRSILTEKVARRGYHLSCEYSIDPLELLYAREVMRTKIAALSATSTLREVQHSLRSDHRQKQRLLPVVDPEGRLTGVVTRGDIREQIEVGGEPALKKLLSELVHSSVVAAYPDEPLRIVVHRMAEKGITRLPVVERDSRKLLGLLSLDDLLKARSRHLEEERHREQTLRFPFSGGGSTGSPSGMSGVRGGKLQSVLQKV
ncbi:MAG TPA: chloride channel protein [Candidatus Acidoferrum sp.]|nr:chloride channel protein [Candidatus Acidoferrum sp.]